MSFQREFGLELRSAGHRPRASPATHHRITQTCGQNPCLDTAGCMQLAAPAQTRDDNVQPPEQESGVRWKLSSFFPT